MITWPSSAYTWVTTGWSEWMFWIRMTWTNIIYDNEKQITWICVNRLKKEGGSERTSDPGGSLGSNMNTFHALGWQPNQRSPLSESTSTLSQSEPTDTDWWGFTKFQYCLNNYNHYNKSNFAWFFSDILSHQPSQRPVHCLLSAPTHERCGQIDPPHIRVCK